MHDCQLHIRQGENDSHFGFLRPGDHLGMVSCDPWFHLLHADGAAFFSLAFPDPGQPLQRVLREKGIVEFTSAAGYIWMRSYVFVDDHPYYTPTDKQGRFEFRQVPPGRYEVVCWMPNWTKARHERDPEAGSIIRLLFNPPVIEVNAVVLRTHGTAEVDFQMSAEKFTARTRH
jgi:hypothetical protein